MKLEIKVGPEVGTKLINDLIKKCVCDEGYRSEAALARALGVSPQKFGRWRKGKSPVSTEGTIFFLALLSMSNEEIMSILSHSRQRLSERAKAELKDLSEAKLI